MRVRQDVGRSQCGCSASRSRTSHFSAMPFVLCSAATVHPRECPVSLAKSAAYRSEGGPGRFHQPGSQTSVVCRSHPGMTIWIPAEVRPNADMLRLRNDHLDIKWHVVRHLPIADRRSCPGKSQASNRAASRSRSLGASPWWGGWQVGDWWETGRKPVENCIPSFGGIKATDLPLRSRRRFGRALRCAPLSHTVLLSRQVFHSFEG
jgi:hypothetical protein